MKTLLLLSFFSLATNADVLKRPDYLPDENHPAPTVVMPRQAQEEKTEPMMSKNQKELKQEKERRKKAVEFFKETEMTE